MREKYAVARSSIAGKGVFATAPIKQGETVRMFTGASYDLVGILRRIEEGKEAGADPLGVDDDEYFDLDEISRTFNHSCNPNCFMRGRSELVALHDIGSGEELTYDYSTTMDDDETKLAENGHERWTCPCRCKAKYCRGLIDQFKFLPDDRKRFYLDHGYIPDFILRKYSAIRVASRSPAHREH